MNRQLPFKESLRPLVLSIMQGYVEVSGDVKYSPEMLEKLRTGLY